MKIKSYIVMAILIIVMTAANVAWVSANETSSQVEMAQDLLITKGTIIKIQAVDTISSQKNKQNDKVHFKVMEDITIGDVTIVPVNSDVEGIITKVKKAGRWDRDGQIEVEFSDVKTKDGQSIPVVGMLKMRGDKPNFLVKYSLGGMFIKGKAAVIKTGEEVNLQVKEDVMIASDKIIK